MARAEENGATTKTDNAERTKDIYKSSYSYKPRTTDSEQGLRMRKTKSGAGRFVAFVIAAVILFASLTLTVHICFKVENIYVEGNYHYSKADIISRSGITEGMNMYSVKKNEVKSNILEKLNGISEVTVTRKLPSDITLTVVEHVPAMYVAVGDSYYILSSSMLVLRPETDISYIEEQGLIRIYTPDILGAMAGELLKTADEDVAHLVAELYASLTSLSMSERVTEINMTDKFDISVNYDEKYTIKLGNALKLHEKLSMAKQIMEKAEKKYGIIDVSDDDVSKGIHTWG